MGKIGEVKENASDLYLLTREEVTDRYGLSKRWLELAATRGDGPPIVRISRRMVRYRPSDVEGWIAAKVDRGTGD